MPAGRLDGVELDDRLARRLGGEVLPAVGFEEEVEADPPAAAVAADLALAVLLDDHRDVQPRERAHVADGPARRRRDHDHDVLAADGRDDLAHARIERARRRVHLVEQAHLAAELGGERRLGERIEVVGPAQGPTATTADVRRLIGDGAGLPRRFLEIGQRQVVGVRVARALARLGADAGALADVPGRLLHRALLEHQLLAHAVLEIEVGVVHAAAKCPPRSRSIADEVSPNRSSKKRSGRASMSFSLKGARRIFILASARAALVSYCDVANDGDSVPVNAQFSVSLWAISRKWIVKCLSRNLRLQGRLDELVDPAQAHEDGGPGTQDISAVHLVDAARLTALTPCQPGRAAMAARSTGLPHQDARMMSGSRRATSSALTARSRAARRSRSSGKMSRPPAISTTSDTQRIPAMSGSGHSSK